MKYGIWKVVSPAMTLIVLGMLSLTLIGVGCSATRKSVAAEPAHDTFLDHGLEGKPFKRTKIVVEVTKFRIVPLDALAEHDARQKLNSGGAGGPNLKDLSAYVQASDTGKWQVKAGELKNSLRGWVEDFHREGTLAIAVQEGDRTVGYLLDNRGAQGAYMGDVLVQRLGVPGNGK